MVEKVGLSGSGWPWCPDRRWFSKNTHGVTRMIYFLNTSRHAIWSRLSQECSIHLLNQSVGMVYSKSEWFFVIEIKFLKWETFDSSAGYLFHLFHILSILYVSLLNTDTKFWRRMVISIWHHSMTFILSLVHFPWQSRKIIFTVSWITVIPNHLVIYIVILRPNALMWAQLVQK